MNPTCFNLEKLFFLFNHVLALFAVTDTQLCSHSVFFAFLLYASLYDHHLLSVTFHHPPLPLHHPAMPHGTLQEMESDPDDEVNMGNHANLTSGLGLLRVRVLFFVYLGCFFCQH